MSGPLPDLLPGYARRYVSANGGCVDVHETHGKLELRQNLPVAVFLADRGERVRLLPVSREPGSKSADATRNGMEWEFKAPAGRTANAIEQALRGANRQAAYVLVAVPSDFDLRVLEQALFLRMRRAANLEGVAILRPDALYEFTRREILDDTFRGKMG